MKSLNLHSLFLHWSLCLALAGLVALPARAADAPAKPARPPIYDTKADGAKQIADALATARRDHKRVLLQFGANWCGWCHKLHSLFQTDPQIAAFLKANYVLVLVDVDKVDGKMHNAQINEKYGNPCRLGLPSLVVLNADGRQLTTQDSGKLEKGDHHDPALVMKFLKEWVPGTPEERVLKMERGCVEDQPQRATHPGSPGNSSRLRLVEDDTAALRHFSNTL